MSRDSWIDVTGGRLPVFRDGQGPPLLMVHGWALDHRMFQPQVNGLGRDLTLYTFDRRGFGAATAPPDMGRETDDLLRLLDAEGLERVHLLGMSQGGRIALRFAARHPDRLHSLLIQGAAVDGFTVVEPETEHIPLHEYAALARGGDLDGLRRRWLAHPMMAVHTEDADILRLLDDILEGYTARDLLSDGSPPTAFDDEVLTPLGRFPHPVLALTGALETDARKAHARKVIETVPRGREEVISGGGHLCNLDRPATYNAAVKAFCLAESAVVA